MNIYGELKEVFRIVFQDPNIEVGPLTSADEIAGWDSLSHIILISGIENHFNIEFSQREIINFNNVGDIKECIEKKIVN